MISSNTLQFQYFWDFNKCLQVIFSQLSFKNFWLCLLVARLFWLKIIKNYFKSPLKVCELKVWVRKGSLISISSESSKIYLLIKVLYRPIWFNDIQTMFIVPRSECLLMLLAAVQLYNVSVLRSLGMKYFSFVNVSISV